jgi:hypothetical protein
LNTYSVDAIGISETSINWNEKNTCEARNIMQKYNKSTLINTSSSIEASKSAYQPGGTATLLTRNLTGRSTGTIKDESGLGRWSGFKIKINFDNQYLNIITVY